VGQAAVSLIQVQVEQVLQMKDLMVEQQSIVADQTMVAEAEAELHKQDLPQLPQHPHKEVMQVEMA
tara:strand:- start:482 stop:679 length:198 start_codon:yes stop_codon:yes gene_type:complete